MAADTFRKLVDAMGRIERAMLGAAALGGDVGKEAGKLGAGNAIRDELRNALSSPEIVRSLQEAITQGLGGGATAQIKAALSQYQASIRAMTAAGQAQATAQQKFAQAHAAALPWAANPAVPAAVRAAITAGTLTPAQAQPVGARLHGIAQRMQTARQQAAQAGTQRAGARRAAQAAATRGQQAALSPQGVPQGGGVKALSNVIAGQGLGGMGSLVGSLFGEAGVVVGYLFDQALKGATVAFDLLQKTVVNARHAIDQLGIWSIGGITATMKLAITEIQKQIYMSRELSDDMLRFGDAQSKAIEKWKDFDVGMERLNFQLATMWANAQSWFADVTKPIGEALGWKKDPLGAIHMAVSPLTAIAMNIYKYLTGKDLEEKEVPQGQRPLTPWEKAFQQIGQEQKDAIANNQLGPGAVALNQRLQMPGQGQVIPGHVNPPAPAPAPPFAAAAAAGAAAGGAGAAAGVAGVGGGPKAPQVANLVPGAQQIVDAINDVMNWLKGNAPARPGGFAGVGGGP